MNYIKEINAFHIKRETEPLTIAAAQLWFVLMDVNNRAGWKKQFSVPVSVLLGKSGLKEGTFKRARTELDDKGYINVQSQRSNRPALYEINSLINSYSAADDDHADGKPDDNVDHTSDCKSDALNKQDEMKQKEIKNDDEAAAGTILFYQENFTETGRDQSLNPIKPYIKKDLQYWSQEIGEQFVIIAMQRALEQGKTKWGYVKKILQNWQAKGVRTMNDILADDAEFRQKQAKRRPAQGRSGSPSLAGTKEIIPEWFKERKSGQKAAVQQKDSQVKFSGVDADKERAELEAMLAGHASGG